MRQPWARRPWMGAEFSGGKVAGGYQVPGEQDIYFWIINNSGAPWMEGAWGGAYYTNRAFGGILAAAAKDAGTVSVTAWWSYAKSLLVTRIDEDGSRVLLRDSPKTVDTPTRLNQASNPRYRDGLALVTAVSGAASWMQSRRDIPIRGVSTAARVTAGGDGQAALRFDGDAVPPYGSRMGMLVRTSAQPASLSLVVDWYDLSSNLIASTTVAAADVSARQANGQYSWCEFGIDTRPGRGQVGQARIVATGLGAGGTMDVTCRMWQDGTALDGDWFDGDVLGGSWRGEPGVSSSTLAPMVTFTDAEAPLDRPIAYEVRAGQVPGYAALTNEIRLPSERLVGEYDVLVTHPGLAATIKVWVESEPEITRTLSRQSFKVLGRHKPVVVTDPQRSAETGTLTLIAENFQERDRLMRFLEDGSPLLLRMKASYGHPALWWLSFGDLTVSPIRNDAPHELRKLKLPFEQVDRPSVATRPLVA